MFSAGIIPPVHYGGTERVVDWLIKELASMGHRVYFFGPEGSVVHSAEKMFHPDFPAGNINENPVDFRDMIPVDTDIVHIHCATSLDYSYPVLKTVHGYPFHKGWVLAQRDQFDETYSFMSDSHRKACGRPENPFVHNGIDLSEYVYSDKKDEYFLFLGKVDWAVKGLQLALKVAMDMKLKLLIAGDFFDPAFYSRILSRLLNDDIQYIGPVGGQEKAKLLSKARALLFPTMWPEPFGLTVIEALASGTPALTSFEGAMPEIMVQGVTGFMCRTVGEMKEQIKLFDKIMPLKCREHVENNFTSTKMALDYLRLYEKVIMKYGMEHKKSIIKK